MRVQLAKTLPIYSAFVLSVVLMICISLQGLWASESDEAVERAARRYRMQVFETFRNNRPEYDRRLAMGNGILDEWRSDGAPAAQNRALIEWFSNASQASKVGSIDRLPEYLAPKMRRRVPSEVESRPQRDRIQRRPRTVQQPSHRQRRDQPDLVFPDDPTPRPKPNSDWTVIRAPNAEQSSSRLPLATVPDSSQVNRVFPRQVRKPTPSPTPLRDEALSSRIPSRRDDELSDPSASQRSPNRIAQRHPVPGPSRIQESSPETNVMEPELDLWSPEPVGSVPFEFSPAPASTVVTAPYTNESPIDLDVLAARIRASNLRVAEIESELGREGLWDSARLSPLVDQFRRMLDGRRLSRLYYQALNQVERRRVAPFYPVEPAIAMLAQRLFEARVAATEDSVFFPPDSDVVSELQSMTQIVESWQNTIRDNGN